MDTEKLLSNEIQNEKFKEPEKKIQIAILGAGISGCASAYFLKQAFDNRVELCVFEKSDLIGGRMATFEYHDRLYESGGTVLHPMNLYMQKFLSICGLSKIEKGRKLDEYFGMYDSNGILFETNGKYFGLFDKFRFFSYFGLLNLFRFKNWVKNLTNDFCK
jgi:prenylcysteine oxidase/farnesylcysteine lyase